MPLPPNANPIYLAVGWDWPSLSQEGEGTWSTAPGADISSVLSSKVFPTSSDAAVTVTNISSDFIPCSLSQASTPDSTSFLPF